MKYLYTTPEYEDLASPQEIQFVKHLFDNYCVEEKYEDVLIVVGLLPRDEPDELVSGVCSDFSKYKSEIAHYMVDRMPNTQTSIEPYVNLLNCLQLIKDSNNIKIIQVLIENQDKRTKLNTIAHEFIHAVQFITDNLKVEEYDEKTSYIWEDELFVSKHKNDYFSLKQHRNFPWEIAAYANSGMLVAEYLNRNIE